MKKTRQFTREHRPEAKNVESSVLESNHAPVMAPPTFGGPAPVQMAADHSAPVMQRQPLTEGEEERTVENFIEILKKLEQAYPDAPPEEIAGRLAMTSQYNGENFQDMMGISESGYTSFEPVEGIISESDIGALRSMMDHAGDVEATEQGIALGGDGNYSALGHVVTGLVAGMNENDAYNPVSEGLGGGMTGSIASGVVGNPTFNNVMGMTLAGDLGQSAAMNTEEIVDANSRLTRRGTRVDQAGVAADVNSTTYVGDGTEATAAEMRGDVDGINMAARWQGAEEGETPSVSGLFSDYYGDMGTNPAMRYDEFDSNVDREYLTEQSGNFADNYKLRNASSDGDLNANVHTEAATNLAVDQFYDFAERDRESSSGPE